MFLMNLAVCLECRRNFRSVRCFYVVTGLKTKSEIRKSLHSTANLSNLSFG